MQSTSLRAYEEIKKSLGKKQLQVLEYMRYHGIALTNSELASQLGWPINTVTPRVHELRGLWRDGKWIKPKLVEEHEKRKCSVTGRLAIAWRIRYTHEIRERQMEMEMSA